MDISVDVGEVGLNCRTSGIIINNNKVLLHTRKGDGFWTPIGGRIKTLESSEEAVKREFQEEIGETVTVNRLLWNVENFFKYGDKAYHEFLFIYLLDIPKDSPVIENHFTGKDAERLIFKWFGMDEIKSIKIQPDFLKEKLLNLPNHVEHIINND